ncbi:unnamed protein product [Camellia sinensis]
MEISQEEIGLVNQISELEKQNEAMKKSNFELMRPDLSEDRKTFWEMKLRKEIQEIKLGKSLLLEAREFDPKTQQSQYNKLEAQVAGTRIRVRQACIVTGNKLQLDLNVQDDKNHLTSELRDLIEARDSEYKAWAHVQTLKSSLDEQTLELQGKVRAPDILKSKHEENEAYISELEEIQEIKLGKSLLPEAREFDPETLQSQYNKLEAQVAGTRIRVRQACIVTGNKLQLDLNVQDDKNHLTSGLIGKEIQEIKLGKSLLPEAREFDPETLQSQYNKLEAQVAGTRIRVRQACIVTGNKLQLDLNVQDDKNHLTSELEIQVIKLGKSLLPEAREFDPETLQSQYNKLEAQVAGTRIRVRQACIVTGNKLQLDLNVQDDKNHLTSELLRKEIQEIKLGKSLLPEVREFDPETLQSQYSKLEAQVAGTRIRVRQACIVTGNKLQLDLNVQDDKNHLTSEL